MTSSFHAVTLICCLFVTVVVALPVSEKPSEDNAWKGKGRTRMGPCSRVQWEANGGFCTDEERAAVQDKYARLRHMMTEALGGEEDETEEEPQSPTFDDILYSQSQTDELMTSFEERLRDRHRRKIRTDFTVNKWNSTIYYAIDGSVGGEANKHKVRSGIAMWESTTCLRFIEIDEEETPPTEQWIVFGMFGLQFGCSSFVGRSTQHVPQPIYLNDICLEKTVVAHEIAHALGVIHEHQRSDRDQFINVVQDNLYMSSSPLFTTYLPDIATTLDIPYDYASVMHYFAQAFSKNSKDTIETKDARYQNTIGQRVELSFLDSKLINEAYCSDKCQYSSTQCNHGGYPDPSDCWRCICPDGFTGDSCNQLEPAVGASCGGELEARTEPQTISSPGNTIGAYYDKGQQCTWRITAKPNEQIVIEFTGSFHIHEKNGACYDWLEVKADPGAYHMPGPRYCGRQLPSDAINTGSNDILLLFRAKGEQSYQSERRGFSLNFHTVGADACTPNPCRPNERCTVTSSGGFTCNCERDCDVDVCEDAERHAGIGNPMNLVMALDTSRRDFKTSDNLVDFVSQCLCSVDKGGQHTHDLAAMIYTQDARYFSTAHYDVSGLQSALRNNYFFTYGNADILVAIETSVEHYYRNSVNERNLLIVHTDSPMLESDTLLDKISNLKQLLRDKHVELIIIAVDLSSSDNGLHKQIAGEWNVFQISSYSVFSQPSQMRSHIRAIVRRVSQISNRQLQTVAQQSTTISTSSTQTSTLSTTVKPSTTPKTTMQSSTFRPTTILTTLTSTVSIPSTIKSTTSTTISTPNTKKSTLRTTTSTPSTTASTQSTTTSTPSTTTSTPSTTTRTPSTTTSTPSTTTSTPSTPKSTILSTKLSTTTSTPSTTTTQRPTTPSTIPTTTTQPTTSVTAIFTTTWNNKSDLCADYPLACSQCGGCGYRVVETWCIDQWGQSYLWEWREEECTEACVINCSFWIGRLYRRSCKVCCNQAVKINDECILIETL